MRKRILIIVALASAFVVLPLATDVQGLARGPDRPYRSDGTALAASLCSDGSTGRIAFVSGQGGKGEITMMRPPDA